MFARLWGWASRTAVSVVLVGVAVAAGVVAIVVSSLVLPQVLDPSPPLSVATFVTYVVVLVTLVELGFAAAAGAFLLVADESREYLRVAVPDGRDWRYVVGATLTTYAVAAGATLATRLLGEGGASPTSGFGAAGDWNSISEFEAANGLAAGTVETSLLALVVLSVLVIGPSEELFFRGVVQRYLSGVFSSAGAIAVTSVLFAAVHAPTFALAAPGVSSAFAAGTIFAISVILGYVYVRTDNLVVPTLVHGVYDATLFGATYLALRSGLL